MLVSETGSKPCFVASHPRAKPRPPTRSPRSAASCPTLSSRTTNVSPLGSATGGEVSTRTTGLGKGNSVGTARSRRLASNQSRVSRSADARARDRAVLLLPTPTPTPTPMRPTPTGRLLQRLRSHPLRPRAARIGHMVPDQPPPSRRTFNVSSPGLLAPKLPTLSPRFM